MNNQVPNILTIAGSDSGGGAGIQADLKTITVLGGYGMSVITALTAQNGLGVRGIHAPDADFVGLQLETVLDGFPVAAAKTGMLFSVPIIRKVAKILKDQRFPLVVDPVCVSQSGQPLLEKDALTALKEEMVPLADLLTPNLPEAEQLTGRKILSMYDIEPTGRALLEMGAKAVLIKGGHCMRESCPEQRWQGKAWHCDSPRVSCTDWLIMPGEEVQDLAQPSVQTSNNHGTGCTLSAAIATFLGKRCLLRDAVVRAQGYLNYCLRYGYAPGAGAGPPNHAAWIRHSRGARQEARERRHRR